MPAGSANMPQNVATISSSVSSRAAAGPNQRRRKSSDGGPGQRDHPDGHPGTSWPTMGARGAMLRSSRREWLQPPRGGRRQTRRFVPKASRPRQRACWAPWAEAFAVRPSPLSAYLTQACQCTIPTAGGVQQRLRDEGGRGNVAAWKCAAAAFRRRRERCASQSWEAFPPTVGPCGWSWWRVAPPSAPKARVETTVRTPQAASKGWPRFPEALSRASHLAPRAKRSR